MEEKEPVIKPILDSCVVWTSIPVLSWILPFLGHVGICNSKGVVHDFQGDGHIGRGRLLFGAPIQKWELDVDSEVLDRAINEVSNEFRDVPFNMLCSNCHFYVSSVLERAGYPSPLCCKWSSVATLQLALSLVLNARSLSPSKFLRIWIPTIIFWGIILILFLL